MTNALATHHKQLIIIVIIGVPTMLAIMGKFFGDFVPAVIMFATAGFDIFWLPKFPGSPNACMAHYNDPCTGRTSWIFGLCILLPVGLAVVYKEMRGDKRGVKGSRLP